MKSFYFTVTTFLFLSALCLFSVVVVFVVVLVVGGGRVCVRECVCVLAAAQPQTVI